MRADHRDQRLLATHVGIGWPRRSRYSGRLWPEDEILIKGDDVAPGYSEDDERTREAFTDDGWFRTVTWGKSAAAVICF